MKRILTVSGRLIFWCSWPVLWLYLRGSKRTRVLIVCGDSVLLVRGWLGGDKWSLPGGGLHKNENPAVGAAREVREETGVELQSELLIPLGEGMSSANGLTHGYISFYIHIAEKISLKAQAFEISEASWVMISELNENVASTDTMQILSQWQQRR